MDPSETIEETHLSRHLNRRRKRAKILQVAFVVGLSLVLVLALVLILDPGAFDRLGPQARPSSSR